MLLMNTPRRSSGDELTEYLTNESIHTADHITEKTLQLINSLVKQSLNSSKFNFELGDNM